jgi:hypothetical protein
MVLVSCSEASGSGHACDEPSHPAKALACTPSAFYDSSGSEERGATRGTMKGGRRPSKAQQERAVGEGLAVGCLSIGVEAIRAQKMTVELAFRHAWRNWSYASQFPTVHASAERDDLMRILRDSAGRRSSIVAEWDCGRELRPGLRSDWEVVEAAATLESDTGVPLHGWEELTNTWTERIGEEHLVRDDDDDDIEPRGLDDDSGFGPDSYFARAMDKDD